MLQSRFGVWVRETRRREELSAEELARRIGWTGVYLRYVEHGDRSAPGAEFATKILFATSAAFDVGPHILTAALAREELWWSWSAAGTMLAHRAADAIIDHCPISADVILARNEVAEVAADAKRPSEWPRPAVVDLLCTTCDGLILGPDGIQMHLVDGATVRPFD